ncbi:MAG: tRNA (adenosine(37)-N6)-threonylcarbamoyltransferase complex transferase subunit TsaD [Chloroflexota bacterium]|nr:tRNA (adenosine(37)-N6)-threonylcarbamoyltransferase complex transferase subunit TsaD [Chloroflexota bacterium]
MPDTILALESSCDEYAAAVVQDGREVLASVVASQAELHARYGGVVPELAGREHLRSVAPVLETVLAEAGRDWDSIDGIAVTQGPGLGGSLLVGINAAKAAAWARGLPCIPVHHIEGHIYANWLAPSLDAYDGAPPPFPALCLVVSGGHTELLLMQDHGDFRRLGQTLDDAAGEAFDKVGRLLGLPFPGGPEIERAARDRTPAERLPRAWLPGTYDFSFSGLKTAVLHRVRALQEDGAAEGVADPGPLARAFQDSVVDVLSAKTARAAEEHEARSVIVAGGVAANGALRAALRERSPAPVRWPPPRLCTDNAAMIGGAAFYRRRTDPALAFDLFSTSGPGVFQAGTG